jgi:hypothetical protein
MYLACQVGYLASCPQGFSHFLFNGGGEGIQLMQSLATPSDIYPSPKMQTAFLFN